MKKSDKKLLFERMNKIGGMPINENNNDDDNPNWGLVNDLQKVFLKYGYFYDNDPDDEPTLQSRGGNMKFLKIDENQEQFKALIKELEEEWRKISLPFGESNKSLREDIGDMQRIPTEKEDCPFCDGTGKVSKDQLYNDVRWVCSNGLKLRESEDKWMQDAVEDKGALSKRLGIPEDENIPMERINKEIEKLDKKYKEGEKMSADDREFKRQLVLAKTFKKTN
jgi:hypothetical protein